MSERIKEERDKVEEFHKKIKALTIEGSVPTEQELIDARQKRARSAVRQGKRN